MTDKEITPHEMFGGTDPTVHEQISELAEHIAIEMDAVDELKTEHAKRKEALDAAKEKLCNMLTEAGMESCKLENGLTPKAKLNRKYFKASGVDNATLHLWLKSVDLADIIVPYVHFQTLQATMKEYEEQGGDVPDNVFTVSLQPTVTMYGRSKFRKERD